MPKSEYKKLKEQKEEAKKSLYKKSFSGTKLDVPLLIAMAPERSDKAYDEFFQLLDGLMVLPMKVVIIDDSEPADVASRPKGHFSWLNNEDGRNPLVKECFMAADMVLSFEEDHTNLASYMEKGAVVIGHERSPFLENYHPNEETGNAFTYDSTGPWDVFRAIVRATETFRFPFDWGNIVRNLVNKS